MATPTNIRDLFGEAGLSFGADQPATPPKPIKAPQPTQYQKMPAATATASISQPSQSPAPGFTTSTPVNITPGMAGLTFGSQATPQAPAAPAGQTGFNGSQNPAGYSDVDPDALRLAKAIRQQEGGVNAGTGTSGETGAWQFMPATWSGLAKNILGNANAPQTPANQAQVAYSRIKQLKDAGTPPDQIAGIWNHGNADYGNAVNTDTSGGKVAYNTPAYVRSVKNIYTQMKNKEAQTATQTKAANPDISAITGAATDGSVPLTGSNSFGPDFQKAHPIIAGIGGTLSDLGKGGGDAALALGSEGYKAFSNAPGIKQAAQAVGGAVGAYGGALGGFVGATMNPLWNIATGRPVLEGEGKAITDTAASTAGFGYQEGEQGLPAAVMGEFGGAVPNTLMGLSQAKQGAEDISAGLKSKDGVQAFQGALSLGAGLVGLGSTALQFKAAAARGETPNLFFSNSVEPAKQALIGAASKLDPVLPNAGRFAEGVLKPIDTYKNNPARVTEAMTKLTDMNREIAKMSPTQTQREASFEKNSPEFLAKEGIPIGKAGSDGKLDTTGSQQLLNSKYQAENAAFRSVLEDSNKYVNLDAWGKEVDSNLQSDYKSQGSNSSKARAEFQKEVAAFKENYKADLVQGPNGEALLPAALANDIKSGLWSKAFEGNPLTRDEVVSDVDFQAGHAMKTQLETVIDDANVKKMNERLGDFAASKKVLEKVNGRVLSGGKMTKMFAQTTGAILGAHLGPAGSIVGAITADALAKYLADPEVSTRAALNIVNRAKQQLHGDTIVEQAQKILADRQAIRNVTPRLAQGKTIFAGPYKGGASGVTEGPVSTIQYPSDYNQNPNAVGQSVTQTQEPGRPLPPAQTPPPRRFH